MKFCHYQKSLEEIALHLSFLLMPCKPCHNIPHNFHLAPSWHHAQTEQYDLSLESWKYIDLFANGIDYWLYDLVWF